MEWMGLLFYTAPQLRAGPENCSPGDFLNRWKKRWVYGVWLLPLLAFAALHFVNLRADFPNHSPWMADWAKYTDEGWYGNAAVRAHLFRHWYLPGDFNPAPALPVWPFLEWLLFFPTGVSIAAARALSVSFFIADMALAYWLVRARSPRWAGLLAVTLMVTSPMLYVFSRLALLEPMLVAFCLLALNLAVRLPCYRRPVVVAGAVGLLFTLMLLTKTTAVFLLPALGWAVLAPLWQKRRLVLRCAGAAGASAAASFGAWMALVAHAGMLPDFKYLIFINTYPKPTEWYWPLLSLWWSLGGAMWGGRILMPLAALLVVAACLAWPAKWSRRLRGDAVFVAAALAGVGYLLFMTYQNHPQPRYYTVVAVFACVVVSQGVAALVWQADAEAGGGAMLKRALALCAGAAVVGIAVSNGVRTLSYAAHPQYTFVDAAERLTRYIDAHPNGNRVLVSVSGDEITMMTHLPSLCDDFGRDDLPVKLDRYHPGWWATWNDIDAGTLEDLHTHYSLEQVAGFPALDHPERNELVLFKLHPLANGKTRDPDVEDLEVQLPGDKIQIPIQ